MTHSVIFHSTTCSSSNLTKEKKTSDKKIWSKSKLIIIIRVIETHWNSFPLAFAFCTHSEEIVIDDAETRLWLAFFLKIRGWRCCSFKFFIIFDALAIDFVTSNQSLLNEYDFYPWTWLIKQWVIVE